jgi:thioesterase domain-containing protein
VPLQPHGKRTPIFAVAGHNGDVFCYRALAQHLGDDQPLYGLEPPGRDGQSEPLTCIEDLAAYFASQMRGFLPGGPYIIAGFCTGGTIAFELGRQLLKEGATINLLALFGAPYPTAYRLASQLRQQFRDQVARAVRHIRVLTSLSSGERRLYIAERLRNRARGAQLAAERPAAPDSVLVVRAKVEGATIAAARRYTPGHFAGRVNLFLPSREWARRGYESLRWRSVAQQAEEYFGPDGCTPDTMLREPYVASFARLFKQCRTDK